MTNGSFIDLFSGIGGFHLALSQLGLSCSFASEINEEAAMIYQKNFNLLPAGDITKIDASEIPQHDFLAAGFPCQPFSKGGLRKGFEDTRGTLFFDILRILNFHHPKYILLENVRNLTTHDGGNTYKVITEKLRKIGYIIPDNPLILSPHHLGIPVLRERVFIPGILRKHYNNSTLEIEIENFMKTRDLSIYSIVDCNEKSSDLAISEYEEKVLRMWDEFYKGIDIKVIGFPIWSDEFRFDYDISDLPVWKQTFIQKNRDLYIRNKKFIDQWFHKYEELHWCNPTHRKFEWQAGTDCKTIYEGLIQFRPSGVRVKRPNYFSTLVAMNHPQIIGKLKRRLSLNEVKKLQSFPKDYILHSSDTVALKQLGNAVNVDVVKYLVQKMLILGGDD